MRSFISDAADSTHTSAALMQKYFCPALLHFPGQSGEQARKELIFWLDQQRKFLWTQDLHLTEIVFTAYDALPGPEIPPCPFHMLGSTAHVYVARYQQKIIWYFLLQDDKLASTLLIGQGDEHYFLDFCL
ncbi:hypothetical protein A0257_19715 [Hymenobacter psoromatis]|nr:hypothetical protein A0257_19715 [Hymenobacter psoromatis]